MSGVTREMRTNKGSTEIRDCHVVDLHYDKDFVQTSGKGAISNR